MKPATLLTFLIANYKSSQSSPDPYKGLLWVL